MEERLPPRETEDDYTECYCEENVYKLCEDLGSGHAVFILPGEKPIAPGIVDVHGQRNGRGPRKVVHWDYHVIYVSKEGEVVDYDSILAHRISLVEYVKICLPKGANSKQRTFRVVECSEYLKHFSSDRSHMRRPDGSWCAPPPKWPPIGGGGMNLLTHFLNISSDNFGLLLDLKSLEEWAIELQNSTEEV
eukprot:Trichotokara_eunicae@DN670_c0_g1_i2.p1